MEWTNTPQGSQIMCSINSPAATTFHVITGGWGRGGPNPPPPKLQLQAVVCWKLRNNDKKTTLLLLDRRLCDWCGSPQPGRKIQRHSGEIIFHDEDETGGGEGGDGGQWRGCQQRTLGKGRREAPRPGLSLPYLKAPSLGLRAALWRRPAGL